MKESKVLVCQCDDQGLLTAGALFLFLALALGTQCTGELNQLYVWWGRKLLCRFHTFMIQRATTMQIASRIQHPQCTTGTDIQ